MRMTGMSTSVVTQAPFLLDNMVMLLESWTIFVKRLAHSKSSQKTASRFLIVLCTMCTA